MSDRRASPRFEARHVARLRFVTSLSGVGGAAGDGLWPTLICQTLDISESGLALLLPAVRESDANFFGVEGPVRVTLGLPTGALEAGAVVARYQRTRGGSRPGEFLICVKITDMDDAAAERLRTHLRARASAPADGRS